jgi:hypothetical protein
MPGDIQNNVLLGHSANVKAVGWPLVERLRACRAIAARRRRTDGLEMPSHFGFPDFGLRIGAARHVGPGVLVN